MAHFAELDSNNTVLRVIVADTKEWCQANLGGTWVQTSYNTYAGKHPENRPLRKNYAGIGFTYDESRDAFIPPRCHSEATLNENTCQWLCSNASHVIIQGE